MPVVIDSIETLQPVTIKLTDTDQDIVYANLSVEERMLSTGNFSFVWKNEIIDEFTDDQEAFIQEYIGKEILITFEENHVFKGDILEIHYFQNDGLTQEFNITGQGILYRYCSNTFTSAYSQKNLSQILEEIFPNNYFQNLNFHKEPVNQTTFPYIVQSNETDFQFLCHLAVRFGEWFYFDGGDLHFGAISTDFVELQANTEVFNISMSSQLPSFVFRGSAYDPAANEMLSEDGQTPSEQGLAGALTSRSDEIYQNARPDRSAYIEGQQTAEGLTETLRLNMESRSARMITLSARSRNSRLKVGQCIKLISGNKTSEYVIIQITHTSNNNQNYQNDFVAVPKKVKVPPYTNPLWFPRMHAHQAMVIDNEDPDGMDRVRVKFVWESNQSAENSPWLRIQNPYAGQSRGFRFVPEVDDEVMVGFENGNAERPYVIGAMFHGRAQSGSGTGSNHLKSISTKSGNSLVLNDEDGSICVTDKGGNTVVMDGSGKITIKCSDSLLIEADNNIEFKSQNIKLNASVKVDIAGKISVDVGASKVETKAININSEATADNTVKSSGSLNIEGTTTTVKGTASTSVEGAMLDLKGTAMTNVKGAILNLN